MDYNRDRQVYDNFKLNAHVYPLDALSSQTISQAVDMIISPFLVYLWNIYKPQYSYYILHFNFL